MPSPLTGLKYFVRSKESWRQLVERVHHHKNPKSSSQHKSPELFSQHKSPESSSQHNNNSISSDLPTVIQQSTEKRGRKSPRRHEL